MSNPSGPDPAGPSPPGPNPDPDEVSQDNPRICQCWHVQLSAIRRAIDAGARTVRAIGEQTRAGTGCGTCRFDLEELLAEAGSKDPDAGD